MPLIDTATLVPGHGNYFSAPIGTPIPADLTAPGSGWENLGHTSLEEVLAISSEGGDKTTLGTLQNKTLRTMYSPRVDTISVVLQQFDLNALKMYYGANSVDINEDGTLLGVPQNPQPTQRAFLAVFVDRDAVFAVYAPKAEIFRGDDLDISSTEDLASLPLAVTPLALGSSDWAYAVTPLQNLDGALAPTITGVTPATAKTGATITITGENLAGATGVTIGGVAATSFIVGSDETMTAVMPTGSAGSAPVVVTTAGGSSAPFAYSRGANA